MVEIGTTVPKPVLHTHLMKDTSVVLNIELDIERAQRRATKCVLNDYIS